MRNKDNLFSIIDKFANYSILVIGDVILDEYIWGKANRLSPEAPVPILEVEKYTHIPGGAANVASNIRTLGGKPVLISITGDDMHSEMLVKSLQDNDIDSSYLIKDPNRPTTVKTRLIAHNQQLTRADREIKDNIPENIEADIYEKILSVINNISLILLSDYAKGVLTPNLTQKIIQLAKSHNKPVLIDPKGLDFTKYTDATLITPNRHEAEMATKSPSGTDPAVLAERILKQINIEKILITLGEDGVLLYSEKGIKSLPAVTSKVYDVTGAGDSLISTIALCLSATGGDIETSVIIGNYAAGVAVRKIGTTAISPEELRKIIERDLFAKNI